MNLSLSSILKVGSILILAISIPACKTVPRIPLNLNGVRQIPLKAGFYITPEFREIAYNPQMTDFIPILVGDTIVNGVNDVVRYAFRESEEISYIEGNFPNHEFDILIIPEITLLELKHGSQYWMGGVGGRSSAIFQIYWKIVDINNIKGEPLWSERITATYNERCFTRWCFQELMEKTIKDQFQQALEKMTSYNWWNYRNR